MVFELQWIVEFGWNVVFICFNFVKGRILSDFVYELFWSECEWLNVVVIVYEGIYSCLFIIGVDRFDICFVFYVCFYLME